MRIRVPTSKLRILMVMERMLMEVMVRMLMGVMERMQMEVMERRFLIRQEEGGAPTSPFLPLLLITPITIPTIIIIIVDILLVLSNSSGTEEQLKWQPSPKGKPKVCKKRWIFRKFQTALHLFLHFWGHIDVCTFRQGRYAVRIKMTLHQHRNFPKNHPFLVDFSFPNICATTRKLAGQDNWSIIQTDFKLGISQIMSPCCHKRNNQAAPSSTNEREYMNNIWYLI